MKKSLKVLTVSLLILSFLVSFNEAGARSRRRRGRRRGRFSLYRALRNPAITKRAGITEAVRKKAIAIFKSAWKQARNIRKSNRKYYVQIRKEYKKEKVSLESVLSLSMKLRDIRWRVRKINTAAKVRVMNSLTLAQRSALRKAYYNTPGRRYRKRRRGGRGR